MAMSAGKMKEEKREEVWQLDFDDMESALQDAGIDPFDFSLMDEDERRQSLEDASLDPFDFEVYTL